MATPSKHIDKTFGIINNIMKQNKAIKLAYAAGFVDGEGSIIIVKRKPRNKKRKSFSYSILVTVSQRDGAIMDWLYGNFGGSVLWKDRKNPCYIWRISHRKAEKFIKLILPFLKYKRPQAVLALRLQQRLYKTIKRKDGTCDILTDNELSIREKMYIDTRKLKHIYTKAKHPNVLHNNLNNGAAVTTKCDNLEIGSDSLNLQEKQL